MEFAKSSQELRFSELIKSAELRRISESEKDELKGLGITLGVVRDTEITGGIKRDCFYVSQEYHPCNPNTSNQCFRVCI